MKKSISLLTVIATCLSLLMTFTSCSPKHPIEEFKNKMEQTNSYQMSITMSNVPIFGTFTITTKIDGNIQYTPAVMFFNEEEYIETVGDVKYKYTKDDSGKWTKEKEESNDVDSSIYGDESMEQLFNPDNFENVKGEENTYKQKSAVAFDEYEDVKITIADDSYTIELTSISDGMNLDVKIVISKLGEIELTLPEVVKYIP